MAKMMVGYTINVLKGKPDPKINCTFSDIANESKEMQTYIRLACSYGLM